MRIIIGSPDPSFDPIELRIEKKHFKEYFGKEYFDINEKGLSEKLYYYVCDILEGRWPEAEPHIKKDAYYAYYYALDIIRGRWPEAEPIIQKHPEYAYRYARDIVKERWKEAEPHIMKDPELAYYYARFIIDGRWPEAESIIMKDPIYGPAYRNLTKCKL